MARRSRKKTLGSTAYTTPQVQRLVNYSKESRSGAIQQLPQEFSENDEPAETASDECVDESEMLELQTSFDSNSNDEQTLPRNGLSAAMSGSEIRQGARVALLKEAFRKNTAMAKEAFVPTKDMQLARVDFHTAFAAKRFTAEDGSPLTLTESLRVLWSNPKQWHNMLGKWMGISGFRAWFERPPVVDFQRMAAVLVECSTTALYDILCSTDPRMATARVQATRVALEMTGAMKGKTPAPQILDDVVARLSPAERKRLIKEEAARIALEEAPADVEEAELVEEQS